MRDAIRVTGVVAALVVCAASTTGFRESYRETNLGGGRFMMVVKVTNRTGMGTAKEYAFRRAAEVCGAAGFDILDGDAQTEQRYVEYAQTQGTAQGTYTGNANGGYVQGSYSSTTTAGATNIGKHEVTLLYQCRGGYVPSTIAPAQGGSSPDNLPRY
jgi:hypothetical protein